MFGFIKPGHLEQDTYRVLVYDIANWSPYQLSNPDRLYERCEKFISTSKYYRNYGLNLKYYLLYKAGRPYRLKKEEFFGPLEHLAMQKQNEQSALACWLLSRFYVAESAEPENKISRKGYLEKAYDLISKIEETLFFELPVLVPGVENECPEDEIYGKNNEHNLFNSGSDPKMQSLPIPYRYKANWLITLGNLRFRHGYNIEAFEFFDLARYYCNQSFHKYGANHVRLSSNIELASNHLDLVRFCNGDSFVSRSELIARFERLEQKVEKYQSDGSLVKSKALEWRAGCYAGLTALEQSTHIRTKYLDALHKLAKEVADVNKGRIDFFDVDPMYQLAHKDESEALEFQRIIKEHSSAQNYYDKLQEIRKMTEEPKRIIHTQSYFEQGTHAHTHNYAPEKNLSEAAAEIQQLLIQLKQNYPSDIETAVREEIKCNPTFRDRLRNAFKEGGLETLKVIFAPLGVPIEFVRGWLEAEAQPIEDDWA